MEGALTGRDRADEIPLGGVVARHAYALQMLVLPVIEHADEVEQHIKWYTVRLGSRTPKLTRDLPGDACKRVRRAVVAL